MGFEGGIFGDTAEQVDDEGMVAHSGSVRSMPLILTRVRELTVIRCYAEQAYSAHQNPRVIDHASDGDDRKELRGFADGSGPALH